MSQNKRILYVLFKVMVVTTAIALTTVAVSGFDVHDKRFSCTLAFLTVAIAAEFLYNLDKYLE